jgi:hypothetical protein
VGVYQNLPVEKVIKILVTNFIDPSNWQHLAREPETQINYIGTKRKVTETWDPHSSQASGYDKGWKHGQLNVQK